MPASYIVTNGDVAPLSSPLPLALIPLDAKRSERRARNETNMETHKTQFHILGKYFEIITKLSLLSYAVVYIVIN